MDQEISILPFSAIIFVILIIGMLLRCFRQPNVVAYIIAGVLIGPYGLALVTDKTMLVQLGSIGVLFLLFFVGMELSLPKLIQNWKIAVLGTIFQILISVALVWVFGTFLDWPFARCVALGFVISLSSTAVVIRILQDNNLLDSQLGSSVLGILLVQDLCIVPMMITINILGGETLNWTNVILQVLCGAGIMVLLLWIFIRKEIRISVFKYFKNDHEMEVFGALMICFGMAVVTEFCHLSAALGAFTAGIIVSAGKETAWVRKNLEPFYVVFVGLFFISVGMLIDLDFFLQHPSKIAFLVVGVFLTNTFINAGIFKMLGRRWQNSLLAGAMLSQVGELSFLLAALGFRTNLLSEFAYQATISVIALSLLFSPAWIKIVEKVTKNDLLKPKIIHTHD